MTTLIEAKTLDGRIIGRCDARCYNAKGKKCTCICGGLNHGAGFSNAVRSSKHSLDVMSKTFEDTKIVIRPVQMPIFQGGKL